jgi:membrane-associated phospholipid phosphatase
VDPSAPGFGEYVLRTIQGADPSINCLPSTHCAMAALCSVAIYGERRRLGAWMILTALAIGAATIVTRQHYLIDVVSGYLLGGSALAVARLATRGRSSGSATADGAPRYNPVDP